MAKRRVVAGFLVGICLLMSGAAAARGFDDAPIRAATDRLVAALQDPDPTAWVFHYTEDAVVVEAGSAPVEGRAQLLELAKAMPPMSAVTLTPLRTEGDGRIAYMYGTASWTNGRAPGAVTQSRVHLVIVWRKEADGVWRVAQEILTPDPESAQPAAPADATGPTPEALVDAQLEAYNRRDLEGFLAFYADDAVLVDYPDKVTQAGKAAMRTRYEKRFANPNLRATIARRIVFGRFVIDHEQITAPPAAGMIEAVAVYELVGGKIVRVTFLKP